MIQIYTGNKPDISKNGIIINPISCEINPILNGENELVMEFAIDDYGLHKYVKDNNFISVPTPDFEENQLYRIYNTKKSMSNDSITAYARHIQFDLAKKVIFNKTLNNANGQQALVTILADTGFTGSSNITIQNTLQYKLRNAMNAVNGSEADSFTRCYGGEIVCNNYNLTINTKRGSDKGVRVTFGYNLEDVEEDLNFDDVVTRLYPYAGDITLSTDKPYVDSPLINALGIIENTIEFRDIKVKGSPDDTEGYNTIAEAQAEMVRRCNKMFEKGLDKITANYVVKMQELSKTTKYKSLGYDVLEKICLGDTVHCYNKNIDIEVEVRCISYKWDCIEEEYIEIELGQFTSNYVELQNSKLDNLDKNIKDTDQKVDDNKKEADKKFDDQDSKIESKVSNSDFTSYRTQTDKEISDRVLSSEFSSYRTQTDREISDRVLSSDFASYRTQTDKEISDRVSKGDDFYAEMKMHPDAIIQTIHAATDNKTILNSSGFRVVRGGFTFEDDKGDEILSAYSGGGVRIGDDSWDMQKCKERVYLGGKQLASYLQLSHILINTELQMDGYNIYTDGTIYTADLEASGSKNCVQDTQNYGKRLINAYETADYYFGDIGSGIIENGECLVLIDTIFQECVNTEVEYHVFTQVYNGAITRIERYKNYFVVYGESNTKFSWELKAKRRGFEKSRLEMSKN